MYNSDLIFTSAGRTIYEIASIGTPAIVLSQNERETTHFFAYEKFGFQNLGLGYDVKEKDILENFIKLVEDKTKRQEMSTLMQNNELKKGRKTVQKIIQNIL
jgi:spore coat polysaccharide biosynthesis predicted glycosyltransferase SpsG